MLGRIFCQFLARSSFHTASTRLRSSERRLVGRQALCPVRHAGPKGRWKTVCLFGGYTRPLETIDRLGAEISAVDRKRLNETDDGFRMSPIEESEGAIAYIDPDNVAHFVHFKSGWGPAAQHFERCVTRPDTVVMVSLRY